MDKTQGRRICDILKEIRNKVAKEGNIDLHQKECNYKGECSGTCPACEAELKKINESFNHKKLLSLAGCVTMMLPLTACTNNTVDSYIMGDIEYREPYKAENLEKEDLPDDVMSGKIEPKIKVPEDEQGEIPVEEELQGDIAVEPEVCSPEYLEQTQGVLPPDDYAFSEEEDFPKGILTLEDLKISEKMKKSMKEQFPNNYLRGVINPNAGIR